MHAVVSDGLLFKIAFRSVYELFVYREKRIRKSFAKRENVLDVPFLLATQIDSYAKFLQLENAFDQRTDDGLQAAFNSIFPIVSHNGYARLEFVHYTLGEPLFDIPECQLRGITYAAPLRARIRLVILDKEASKPTVKEVRENEVYMVKSIDDAKWLFVINGTERDCFPAAPFSRRVL